MDAMNQKKNNRPQKIDFQMNMNKLKIDISQEPVIISEQLKINLSKPKNKDQTKINQPEKKPT